jgi:hypothetical protein
MQAWSVDRQKDSSQPEKSAEKAEKVEDIFLHSGNRKYRFVVSVLKNFLKATLLFFRGEI